MRLPLSWLLSTVYIRAQNSRAPALRTSRSFLAFLYEIQPGLARASVVSSSAARRCLLNSLQSMSAWTSRPIWLTLAAPFPVVVALGLLALLVAFLVFSVTNVRKLVTASIALDADSVADAVKVSTALTRLASTSTSVFRAMFSISPASAVLVLSTRLLTARTAFATSLMFPAFSETFSETSFAVK